MNDIEAPLCHVARPTKKSLFRRIAIAGFCTLVFGTAALYLSYETGLFDKLGEYIQEVNTSRNFRLFTSKYDKLYRTEEERKFRYNIFKQSLKEIDRINKSYSRWSAGINFFSDLADDEFTKIYSNCYIRGNEELERISLEFEEIPNNVDWRQQGCVSEVKNQAECGSCWAFSTTGAIEGAACANMGQMMDLSEQQLVDCSNNINQGCVGGEPKAALKYVESTPLCAEKDYPYRAMQANCTANQCLGLGYIHKFVALKARSHEALKTAIARKGPISVAIAVSHTFKHYKNGVFDGSCGDMLNHAVLVVGYGVENGIDYYLIKNSWSSDWGMDGYMKIAMKSRDEDVQNKNNIASGDVNPRDTPTLTNQTNEEERNTMGEEISDEVSLDILNLDISTATTAKAMLNDDEHISEHEKQAMNGDDNEGRNDVEVDSKVHEKTNVPIESKNNDGKMDRKPAAISNGNNETVSGEMPYITELSGNCGILEEPIYVMYTVDDLPSHHEIVKM